MTGRTIRLRQSRNTETVYSRRGVLELMMASLIVELLQIDCIDKVIRLINHCHILNAQEGIIMTIILLLTCAVAATARRLPSGLSPLTSLCKPSEKAS